MKNIISQKVQSIELSGIRKFFNKVAGFPDSISLTIGQPDFNVPNEIKNAMIAAINDNKTIYTSNAGIDELREEICLFLKGFKISYTKEEVCLTVGGSEGLMSVFMTLLNTGDKVLIPTPAYPSYESIVKLLGGEVVNYDLNPEDFSINLDSLEKIIEEKKPKVIVLSYPSNPTGAILTKEKRDKLSKIILKENIILVSDEIYSSICFNEEYYSICQIEEIRDKVILVSGFSKMFSMTGLRLGYVCATRKFMESIIKVHQYNVSCAPSISQYGALQGLKKAMTSVETMVIEYKRRRDFVYARLKEMGLEVYLPEGAFYIFPSIKKYNIDSETFCERLLKEANLAVVPGSAFGSGGEGYIRISYAYNMIVLQEAMDKLEFWLKSI